MSLSTKRLRYIHFKHQLSSLFLTNVNNVKKRSPALLFLSHGLKPQDFIQLKASFGLYNLHFLNFPLKSFSVVPASSPKKALYGNMLVLYSDNSSYGPECLLSLYHQISFFRANGTITPFKFSSSLADSFLP